MALFGEHGLVLALLLSNLLLQLSCHLFAHFADASFLLLLELGAKGALHLLVDVVGSLSIIDNLLLLEPQSFGLHSVIEFSILGLGDDLSLQLNLLLKLLDLLS